MRLVWNGISALAVGLGIWATHFIAVLAFRPGFAFSYDFGLTALSLLIAVIVCGGGIGLAAHSKARLDRILGGATVGVGISTMHYTGIAALMLDGEIVWQSGAVTISILAGIVLAGLSSSMCCGQKAAQKRRASCWAVRAGSNGLPCVTGNGLIRALRKCGRGSLWSESQRLPLPYSRISRVCG